MFEEGRAVVLDKPDGKFTVEEYPVPEPEPKTVLIKQEMCGVCGTDHHMYHGHLPGIKYPIVLGHEIIGRISALGEGVKEDARGKPVKEGDRVIVVPGVFCGRCYFCVVLKEPTRCLHGTGYGFIPYPDKKPHFQGGYADYVYLSMPNSNFLKTDIDPEVAVLLEPFSIAMHSVERAKLSIGDTVVIQGCGAIGLLTLIAAKESGASEIIVTGAPKARLQLAKELGADLTININDVPDPKERVKMVKEETTYGADVVFECAGVPAAVPEGIEFLRDCGKFVEPGHFTDAGTCQINPFKHLTTPNITIYGVFGGDVSHFVKGLPILESVKYPLEKMVSHKLPLERAMDAMDAFDSGFVLDGREAIKIVLVS